MIVYGKNVAREVIDSGKRIDKVYLSSFIIKFDSSAI